MTLLIHSHRWETDPTILRQQAWTHYSCALYAACRQTDDHERREQAYHDLHRYLYRVAYNYCPDLADDVTQRAVFLVYEQIDRCQHPATFLSFARYKMLQAFKLETSQKPAATSPLLEDDQESGVHQQQHFSPLDHLEHEETMRALLAAIQRLPDERQRYVVVLKYVAGLSDAPIARRLSITANHVRVLRNRALERLRNDTLLQQSCQIP